MNQEIIVSTKGQLMAAVLAFNDQGISTTIILKRKTGTTRFYHPGACLGNMEAGINKLRARIRRLPAKELLA